MTDTDYMRLALQMAESTQGQTSPNPVVGAVVVKNGKVIGMGAHLQAGHEHAEVHALSMAGAQADGATIYITLEPCSHFGLTPPCANLIIEKNIKRAVIATYDPNPDVAGQGVKRLEQAGIEVTTGVGKEQADWLNRHFFHYIETRKPYVTLKTAASLDGKTSTYSGESQWITGEKAREDSHVLRHQHDAILVGIGTVLQDDPTLTARLKNGASQPTRIVLDHHLKIPLTANMLQDDEAPVWIFCAKNADKEKLKSLEESGASVFPSSSPYVNINEVLQILGDKKVLSVYVEGGAEIHGSFLENQAFQEMICYIAPKLIGGKAAPSVIGGQGIASIMEVPNLNIHSVENIGDDIKITATVKRGENA
ncbi:diaminohydroxyphosphoribosylaminopyrimidine deaminase/5-amino-6-(5-phosphoribosylamino)uracil reductase [Salibacterium salarium]|uniref:bifunctional diaminohydroxyphosphoribosylaminopyrimidine deaminase/5-amino-6-(5-phosphoribosylamino)uracil reductase RibD n=1 Tax=Salibacterium salarium TaxID=284579 RepID=UPI00278AC984|nr:bifunctional diaminohydroxyphosphoribosylaminopyrimidine deaminase/5-amino-6-(5-phosphoribosylamino)uracil reductase RibD [Salibacterium salarium]MDQ0299516.1 diaminohydroxyphosphoribosylaminopyrimidine deaminase/5-amino-6-(5-phosphoribosylamino)uracil reductase [Salibacterium salarium]